MTIVHITTAHTPEDPRIFHKECISLRSRFNSVILIAPAITEFTHDRVKIIKIPAAKSRIGRIFFSTIRALFVAANSSANIYHIHDPELLLISLPLRAFGRVVYDVHEDYVTAAMQRSYLPGMIRRFMATVISTIEKVAEFNLDIVIAERYYRRRFSRATQVLNYPFVVNKVETREQPQKPLLLYTGSITKDRGALNHAGIVNMISDARVSLYGYCEPRLVTEIYDHVRVGADRLEVVGGGVYVPHRIILNAYNARPWLCGLAIFPRTDHYYEKELTKLFEYMAFGLPVLCSDFPVWRALIEENGVGICVDPNDEAAIKNAITMLLSDRRAWLNMSRRGMLLAKNRYSWESQARNLISMYESMEKKVVI